MGAPPERSIENDVRSIGYGVRFFNSIHGAEASPVPPCPPTLGPVPPQPISLMMTGREMAATSSMLEVAALPTGSYATTSIVVVALVVSANRVDVAVRGA